MLFINLSQACAVLAAPQTGTVPAPTEVLVRGVGTDYVTGSYSSVGEALGWGGAQAAVETQAEHLT